MKKLFAIMVTIILVSSVIVVPASAAEKNLCNVFEDYIYRTGNDIVYYFKSFNPQIQGPCKINFAKDIEFAVDIICGDHGDGHILKQEKDLFANYSDLYCMGYSGLEPAPSEAIELHKNNDEVDWDLFHKVPEKDFKEIFLSYFEIDEKDFSKVKDFVEYKDGYYYIMSTKCSLKGPVLSDAILYGYTPGSEKNVYEVYANLVKIEDYKTYDFSGKTQNKDYILDKNYSDFVMEITGKCKFTLKYDGKNVKYLSCQEIDVIPDLDNMIYPNTVIEREVQTNIKEGTGVKNIDITKFADGTTVTVSPVTDTKSISTVKTALKNIIANEKNITVLEFSAINGNKIVQPNGKVKVTIEIPKGYNADKLGLYYISDDGKSIEQISIVTDKKNGTFSTELSHFSKYAIIEKQSSPNTGNFENIALITLIMCACGLSILASLRLLKKQ